MQFKSFHWLSHHEISAISIYTISDLVQYNTPLHIVVIITQVHMHRINLRK